MEDPQTCFYGIWLFTLTLMRGIHDQQLDKFDIGEGLEIGDIFNNVVIRSADKENEKFIFSHVAYSKTSLEITTNNLLQKHQLSGFISDFNISRYFLSYLRIVNQFSGSRKKLEKLVLYTNAPDIDESIKLVKNCDSFSKIMGVDRNDNKSYYLNIENCQEIVNALMDVPNDMELLEEYLYSSTQKNILTLGLNEDIMLYYHSSLIDERVLEIILDDTDKFTTVQMCKFHCDFLDGNNISKNAKELYRKLKARLEPKHFKNAMKNIRWEVCQGFGQNNSNEFMRLPSYKKITKNDVISFFDVFEIKVSEPCIGELTKHVKENETTFKSFFQYHTIPLYITREVQNFIRQWKQENRQTHWIRHKEKNDFFKDLKIEFRIMRMKMETVQTFKDIERIVQQHNMEFQTPINGLEKYLKTKPKRICYIKTEETKLSSIKIVAAIRDITSLILFVSEKDINQENTSTMLRALDQDSVYFVFIVLDTGDNSNLSTLIDHIRSKKIIFISPKKPKFLLPTIECQQLIDDKLNINDLKDYNGILDIEVNCQGNKTRLRELIDEESLATTINPSILKMLITENDVHLCNDLLNDRQRNFYYVPRKLSGIALKPSVLQDKSLFDIFAISGDVTKNINVVQQSINSQNALGEFNATKSLKKLVDGKEESAFDNLCDKQLGTNIHWIQEISETIFLRKTNSDTILHLMKHRDFSEASYISECDFFSAKAAEKFVIISGQNGSGKTELLKQFTKHCQNKHSFRIVISLTLTNVDFSNAAKENITIDWFLQKVLQLKEKSFEQEILKCMLSKKGGIICLFDEFDKLEDEHKVNAIELFKMLKTLCVEKIVVTANVAEMLEKTLKTFSFNLENFSKNDQQLYLVEMYKFNKVQIVDDDEILNKYIYSLLASTETTDEQINIFGVPLYLMFMQQIFFKKIHEHDYDNSEWDVFEDFIESKEPKLPKIIDVVFLHDNYLKQQYFQELRNSSCTTGYTLDVKETLLKAYINCCKKLALLNIFSDHQLKLLFGPTATLKMKAKLNKAFEHSVQVKTITEEKKFVHTTYVDYFAAKFISKQIFKDISIIDHHTFILNEIFCNDTFRNVRFFLNNFIGNVISKNGYSLLHYDGINNDTIEDLNQSIIYKAISEQNNNILKLVFYSTKKCEKNSSLFNSLLNKPMKCELTNGQSINNNFIELNETLTPLHLAALGGYKNTAIYLLEFNACIDIKDENGNTPLHYSIRSRCTSIVELLLNRRANVDAPNSSYKTPLCYCAEHGNIEFAELLINKKANINVQDHHDNTPLHWAASSGHLAFVKLLLKHKVNTDIMNFDKYSPLHVSAKKGYADIVTCLIQNKTNINAQEGSGGNTPLHLAVQFEHLPVVKILLRKIVNIETINNCKYSPLHVSAISGRVDIFKCLIESKANVTAKGGEAGNTPLHLAAKMGHLSIIKQLLKNNTNTEVVSNKKSVTLNMSATKKVHSNTVKTIEKTKVNINAENRNKDTPLHLAVEFGHLPVVKFLLENNVKIETMNKLNHTPLHVAVANDRINIVEYLIEQKANINTQDGKGNTPLHLAAEFGHLSVVKFLLENKLQHKQSIEAFNSIKRTPLHTSAMGGHVDIVNYLIENKANVNAQDEEGNAPIHLAAEFGHLQIVKLLVENNVDIDTMKTSKSTPLHVAAKNGHCDVVKYLIGKKANINVQDSIDGDTPLHLAAHFGHLQLVKLLLDNHADRNIVNKDNQTPSQYVNVHEYSNIVKLIQNFQEQKK